MGGISSRWADPERLELSSKIECIGPRNGTLISESEHLVWHDLACYSCALENMKRAGKLLDKAIELGGKAVKLQALENAD